jgi:serine/threonine protein kinase
MDGHYRRTGRRVTVQQVREDLTTVPGFTERLADIGRAAAGVRDPHLLALYDLVDTGPALQLIAEWCDGRQLSSRRPSTLSPRGAARVVDGVLGGLEALHSAGLVHGHVDAGTVLLQADGRPRLAELAVCAAAAGPGVEPADDVRAAARLGLEVLGGGGRLDGVRRVLRSALQEPGAVSAASLRASFEAAATAALGDDWAAGDERALRRHRRRWAVTGAGALVLAAGIVTAVLLLTGGGAATPTPAGPLTLAPDASLTVTPATGGCNTTFVFVGRGSVRGTGTLVYRWEQSDGASSADTPLTVTADDGSFQLTQAWRLQGAQTVDGAMTLHILKPVDLVLRRTFRYACT